MLAEGYAVSFSWTRYVFDLYRNEIQGYVNLLGINPPTMKRAAASAKRYNNRLRKKYPLLVATGQIELATPADRYVFMLRSQDEIDFKLINTFAVKNYNDTYRYIKEHGAEAEALVEVFSRSKWYPQNNLYCLVYLQWKMRETSKLVEK